MYDRYTMEYNVAILVSQNADTSSLRLKVQVLTREPYLQDAMNIFIDNDYH